MFHSFQCPHCHKRLKTEKPAEPGKIVICPGCSQQFPMPYIEVQQANANASPPPAPPSAARPPLAAQVIEAEAVPPPTPPSTPQAVIPPQGIQVQLNDAAAQLNEAANKLKSQAMPVIKELAKNLPQDASKRRALIIAASVVGGLILMSWVGCLGIFFVAVGSRDTQVAGDGDTTVAKTQSSVRRSSGRIRSKHEVRAKLNEIKDSGRVDDVMTFAVCKYGAFLQTFGKPESEISLQPGDKLWRYSFSDGSVVMNISITQFINRQPSGEGILDPDKSKIIVNSMDIF